MKIADEVFEELGPDEGDDDNKDVDVDATDHLIEEVIKL